MVSYGTAALGTIGLTAPGGAALEATGEDGELMARLASGDISALGVLYDRYAAQALGLARRILGDAEPAEEVVRDAFLAAWRRAGTFPAAPGGARGWLFGIVHQAAIERRRAARGTANAGVDRFLGGEAEAEVWRDLASRLDRRRLAEALRSLPPVQREAIELAFFDGLSHVEIAEQLDLPLGTIAGRIRLGLAKLLGLIEESLAR
jgi:RNA polymerase sigma-70 factor, ECF subfamily